MAGQTKKMSLWIWLSRFIFLVGFLVLAFPIVSQIIYYQASHANINAFQRAVTTIDRTEIKRRLKLAKAYNASLSGGTNQTTKPVLKDPYSDHQKKAGRAEYARMLEVREQIGHVTIPKINQDLPIYAGSGEENLQRGVGHLEGTSLPVGGASTHAVLTAHRGLPTARLFTDLDKMRRGDRFYIEHLGGKLAYQVDDIKVITPDRLEELSIVPDEDYITLLTCTPYMINSHRLLVRGKRIPYKESVEHKDQELGQQGQVKVYGFMILGLVLSLFLLWYRKRKKETKAEMR
ncbi:TPA: class C sortase [Streptococcus pyogenes]|uniref:class C sortase n=1 Tax=Streptococcus pyogenes TaxID=1314 RepID=UPI0007C2F711|nr:class C sortase [Streptococcus pyogenes]HER4685008.1 class C sortase [Streptococcus pyogenes NGAS353]HER4760118.1 class C sortase [Streptococcus pyogenes NGAS245]OAC61647.1 sortase [Streptococcus pyogenes]OAC65792.1 sortase [Streptococcus pyogenes]OAC78516.1 sortase [Streptococcus pyogenes]